MNLKPHHILEAVLVVFILSIMLYIIVPKALRSQKRADVVKLERAMEAIQQYFIENPNDATLLKKNAGIISNGWAGPWYNSVKNELTLLYMQEDSYELMIEKLEQYDERIQFPEWNHSELHVYGYAVYAKKSPYHTGWGGFQKKPTYAAAIARVGTDSQFDYEPYRGEIDGNGNFDFKTFITPFDPSNGMNSRGEFLVNTKNVWSTTTAVLMASPINEINVKHFPGFSWDTTKIIRGQ